MANPRRSRTARRCDWPFRSSTASRTSNALERSASLTVARLTTGPSAVTTGMQAIDNGRSHSLRRGFRRATTNHNLRRTKNMLKRISALFIATALLAGTAVLPTFAQDKMKDKDKMEGQDKMKDKDKMENQEKMKNKDKMEGQDKMEDKDKMADQDKMADKDKMAGKGKKSKKTKKGDKMEDDKMKDDKMKEKKP